MYRGSGPRILPIIIVVLVIALVVAALVAVGRMVFVGNGTSNDQANHDGMATTLLDTSDARAVRWAVRGPIVGNETFQSYQITITPTKRTYTMYKGYLDEVVATHSYDNNTKAYEQFVYALNNTGVTTLRSSSENDIRGVCATRGLAFVFETVKDGVADNSEWTSTCAGSKGTMTAKPAQLQALFVNQVPDFAPLFDTVY